MILFIPHLAFSGNCEDWFKALKMKQDKDCLIECASASVDMGTFSCPNECASFCKSDIKTDWIFSLSDLYPGLTPQERAIVSNEPKKAYKAYQLSWESEKTCLTVYPRSDSNDASDACRHFIWAGLLYKEFGNEFSNQILNAHEANPNQPEEEKSMDLANNRLGIIEAGRLQKEKKLSEKSLLDSFSQNLKYRNIIILNKPNKEGAP